MTRATVNYLGVPLDCSYGYVPGSQQTWTDPGYPACAEIDSVKVGGVEILDMLSNHQRESIETLILEEREQADGDAMYQARRHEREYEA